MSAPAPADGSKGRNLSQKVAFNTALMVGGRLAVSASGLVGTIVATRYLGTEGFGQLITAITFVALFGVLTDVGVWTIAAREMARRPEDEQEILTTASLVGAVLTVGTLVAILVGALVVYGGQDRDLVRLGIVISVTQLLVAGPFGASSAYMTAHQMAVPGAIGALLAAAGFLAALGLAIGMDLGFGGIAAAYALSAVLNTSAPIYAVARRVSLRPAWNRPLVAELMRAALPQGFVLAIITIYIRVDTVLLSVLATDRDVGLYGVAYRVLEFVLQVPLFATTTVFPELARAGVRTERLRMLTQGLVSAVVLAAVPMVCVVIGFAPEIIRIAGGESYDDAVPVLRLLAVAGVFSFPLTVLFSALVATDQQRRVARFLAFVLLANVVLNVLLIGPFGARGAASALVASELVSLVLAWRLFRRVGRAPRVQRPTRLLLAAGLCAAPIVVLRAVVAEPAAHPVIVLALGSAAATASFAVAAVALRAVPVEVTSAVGQLRRR